MQRILFIDDEPDIINLYKFYLKDFDCEIVTLTRGVDAYLEIISTKFDLIVSDLKMPEMSGEELLYEIMEAENLETPILVISGHLDGGLIEKLKGFGNKNINFLSKPFNRDNLLEEIFKYVEIKKKTPVHAGA